MQYESHRGRFVAGQAMIKSNVLINLTLLDSFSSIMVVTSVPPLSCHAPVHVLVLDGRDPLVPKARARRGPPQ
jgi:hypothetical protein